MQSPDFHPHDALQSPSQRAATGAVERERTDSDATGAVERERTDSDATGAVERDPADVRGGSLGPADASDTESAKSTASTSPTRGRGGRWR
jgi:hypothetical protein